MHIPDGFLDPKVALSTAGLSVVGLGAAVRNARLRLPPRKIPLMGLSAAFIFAAQMLNFPVAGGTSGHLIGGVLASVLLGPGAAVLVLTAVLIVQCFVFADGGILALGANVFNMGIVSSVGGYFVYRVVWKFLPGERGRLAAIAFASWCATVLAAVVCAGQLALSHTVRWSLAFPAMANVHMLIGVGEALLTTMIIYAISQARPDLLEHPSAIASTATATASRRNDYLIYGGLLALGLAAFVAPFACPWPDGLDRVAESLGFKNHEGATRAIRSPMADYHLPGVASASVATAIAGVIGTLIVFGLALLLARVLIPKKAATAGLVESAPAAAT
jgi:cobalt/nickel transport system permease protein